MLRYRLHGGFEIFVRRIDEKPLSQNLMRQQRREFGLNGSVMLVVRTDQNSVPVPAAGFGWLNEQQHLTLEEVCGRPTEHSRGKEGRVLNQRVENPLVSERLHVGIMYVHVHIGSHRRGHPASRSLAPCPFTRRAASSRRSRGPWQAPAVGCSGTPRYKANRAAPRRCSAARSGTASHRPSSAPRRA